MADFVQGNNGAGGEQPPGGPLPEGYHDIPEEERKKATKFFDYARKTADTGNFEYSIELFLQGLAIDPEAVEQHQALRDVSLKRKASGGKAMGMMDRARLPKAKDDKQAMLNAEKQLGYDPGNTDHMVSFIQAAHKGGYFDTVMWLGPILLRANVEGGKPDVKKFLILKDIYKSIRRFDRAVEACNFALQLRPNDMDLQGEAKNLAAEDAMQKGRYSESFRASIRDMARQKELLVGDQDHQSADHMTRMIKQTEADYLSDPDDEVKVRKFVAALEQTEDPQHENTAIEVLEKTYEKNRKFSLRQKAGQLRLKQLERMRRAMAADVQRSPADEDLKRDYLKFVNDKAEQELTEFRLWSDNYPTDTRIRYDIATRLYALGRYDEAIPVLQQVRSDPKFRIDATVYLGRAFLESQFLEEAIDTLKAVIEEYPIGDDDRAKNMHYWLGRALEQQGDTAQAIKEYSRVAQIEFTYRDVQQRIRKLRQRDLPGAGGAPSPVGTPGGGGANP